MTEENNNLETNSENSENKNLQADNEEQNSDTKNIDTENNHEDLQLDQLKGKHIFKYILIFLITFLTVFVIVYLIVDYNMHKLGFTPFEVTFGQMEKMLNQEEAMMNNIPSSPVTIETKKDKYILTVDLKQFNNDAENIKFEATNNGIKIQGDIYTTKDGKTESHSFYQNIISPETFITEKIKQEQKGNKLIITIPVLQEG